MTCVILRMSLCIVEAVQRACMDIIAQLSAGGVQTVSLTTHSERFKVGYYERVLNLAEKLNLKRIGA